jgi:hypothetical protein
MKTATKHVTQALALGLILCGASQAKAQTYTYTPSNGGDLVSGFTVSIDNSSDSLYLVGGILMTAGSGEGVSGYSSYTTVCGDLLGALYLGKPYTFNDVRFSGQTGINPSWGNNGSGASSSAAAAAAVNNAAWIYFNHQNASTPDQWAALQLAVWKALYDTESNGSIDNSASTERFNVTQDVNGDWTTAQTWLSQLPANPQYTGYLLYPNPLSQNSATAQEVLIPVPEPQTLAAGAILLVPFAMSSMQFLRRRCPA